MSRVILRDGTIKLTGADADAVLEGVTPPGISMNSLTASDLAEFAPTGSLLSLVPDEVCEAPAPRSWPGAVVIVDEKGECLCAECRDPIPRYSQEDQSHTICQECGSVVCKSCSRVFSIPDSWDSGCVLFLCFRCDAEYRNRVSQSLSTNRALSDLL